MAEARADIPRAHHHAIVITFWAAATLVNLFKPFHMDDTAGLLIAQAIAEAPFHVMGQMLNWLDTPEPIFVTNQPHLFFYIIAVTGRLFGNSEIAVHLMLSIFSLVALYSFYFLARRFVPRHALWLVCSFAIGPGFLINQNAMTDVPLLALLGLSVLLLTDPQRPKAASGFAAFSLALLTKYSALFLFPALIWAALRRARASVWVLAPVAAIVGWSLFNIWDYGAIHITGRPGNVGGLVPSPKLAFALICNLGLFVVPVAAALIVRKRIWLFGWIGGFALFFGAEIWGLGQVFQPFMLANAGLFASAFIALAAAGFRIVELVRSVWHRPDGFRLTPEFNELTLALWLVGGAGFLATFPPFMASRHAMLLLPPLAILALSGPSPKIRWPIGVLAAGCWVVLGLFVAVNDFAFARFYKDTAPLMAARAFELAGPDSRVFTRGHWGWQWYVGDTGMIEYDSEISITAPGDILVDPVGISSQHVADIAEFEIVAYISQPQSFHTALDMHRFYASGALALPVFKPGVVRQVRILRKRP